MTDLPHPDDMDPMDRETQVDDYVEMDAIEESMEGHVVSPHDAPPEPPMQAFVLPEDPTPPEPEPEAAPAEEEPSDTPDDNGGGSDDTGGGDD
ncbi:hypothetical protein DFH06DRAFT_1348755 [Mycena polygramma]|nr:hypothetical protein DFH06DRAFT_1348755 [Mycena polygramma]